MLDRGRGQWAIRMLWRGIKRLHLGDWPANAFGGGASNLLGDCSGCQGEYCCKRSNGLVYFIGLVKIRSETK